MMRGLSDFRKIEIEHRLLNDSPSAVDRADVIAVAVAELWRVDVLGIEVEIVWETEVVNTLQFNDNTGDFQNVKFQASTGRLIGWSAHFTTPDEVEMKVEFTLV